MTPARRSLLCVEVSVDTSRRRKSIEKKISQKDTKSKRALGKQAPKGTSPPPPSVKVAPQWLRMRQQSHHRDDQKVTEVTEVIKSTDGMSEAPLEIQPQ